MLQFMGLQRSGHDLANEQHGKKIRMSRSKHKSSSNISGTAKKCQELEAQRKNKKRKK